jgi:alpha-amylase
MPSVCFYFQIHQPFRLRKYTAFDTDSNYFDNTMNAEIVRRIAERCYVPMNRLLLDLVRLHGGRFRVAFSITGTALEQLESYAPEALQGLQALAETRCVEFLGETYYHSLAALHSPEEFREQVELHRKTVRRLFGQTPKVFRNTELIYSNHIGAMAGAMGFSGVLAEGWEPVLNKRSAAFVYRGHGVSVDGFAGAGPGAAAAPMPLILLRNHRLSDAIAFQFADARSPEFPLTEEKFAALVSQIGGRLCNLFMDYETFGEHQSEATGIFEFMRAMPGKLLAQNVDFRLPGELVAAAVGGEGEEAELETAGELDVPHPISWADEARDLGAWMGNAMQANALQELYKLEKAVKGKAGTGGKAGRLLSEWRKLTTSDHFYYMSTKEAADGGVHAYFRPYDSPYDAYINFMNIVDSVRSRAE